MKNFEAKWLSEKKNNFTPCTWTVLLLYSQEIDHIKLSDIGTQMKETHKQPRNQILKLQATVEVQAVNWYKQQIEKQREKH